MARPVVLGPYRWPSVKLALIDVRRILHSTPHEVDLVGDARGIVAALYATHHEPEVVAIRFVVGQNDYNGALSNGFHAIDADGNRHRFSYKIGQLATPQHRANHMPSPLKAMRGAIMESQNVIRRAYYGWQEVMPCQRCGEPVTKQTSHVDHVNPKFRVIADGYIEGYGEPAACATTTGDAMADDDQRRQWIRYHDRWALVRIVVCPTCNAKAERKERCA